MNIYNKGSPFQYDILKLVSSGKRYDNLGDEVEAKNEEGVEIERVVAKLGDLVCYADIERPPSRNITRTPASITSNHSSVNFKRFRKVSPTEIWLTTFFK
ncbi:unnamed protein product [Strongylus vulgaris]|uniref:Uncharacterized protein n=1 Tax=Strongylus vulgaris TaxID=40348 RepID=A0A3P7JRD1_STRVU|nr:unnamed protein product [Strongylus vulgaris]